MGVQILSYELTKDMSSKTKIEKILETVKKGDIIMLEGKLKSEEETALIEKAMKNISKKFSGIEIASLDTRESKSLLEKIKQSLIKIIAKDRVGITVIGPSKIIKEIKMDPQKLEILFK